jgi:16S rRNA (cytidine1402-2'-O)-methyltransferase
MLFVIATPIGNRGDITLRAIETLRSVDLVAAEDTRHSGLLLQHLGISKPFVSYHQHNEARRTAELITRLVAGENIALLTDAGLPGISDPGHRLLRACIERNVPYTILPGPSSVLTALVGSGFVAEKFYFGGFLPTKSGGRERDLRAALLREETSIFFESPHRLLKTLAVCAEHASAERAFCVARELTKQFEEFRIGTATDLLAHYSARPPKGEIVFLMAGAAQVMGSARGPRRRMGIAEEGHGRERTAAGDSPGGGLWGGSSAD